LEVASNEDLARASKQGTILEIMVNGKKYGSGGFRSPSTESSSLGVIALIFGVGMLIGSILYEFRHRSQRKLLELPACFHENLQTDSQDVRPID
jgi:hypothetical protein